MPLCHKYIYTITNIYITKQTIISYTIELLQLREKQLLFKYKVRCPPCGCQTTIIAYYSIYKLKNTIKIFTVQVKKKQLIY